jgi:hypothetical protein
MALASKQVCFSRLREESAVTSIKQGGLQHGAKPMARLVGLWTMWLLWTGALLCSCSSGLERVDGKIVDTGEHDAPLSNAVVVAVRERGIFSLAGSAAACEDLELTRSDAEGRFHFDPWSPPHRPLWKVVFPDQYWVTLTVYKRGFASLHDGPGVRVTDSFDGIIRLERFDDSFEHQLQYMHDVEQAVKCDGSDYYLAKRPLLHELEMDATALATTPQQMEMAKREFGLASLDHAYNIFKNPGSRSQPAAMSVPGVPSHPILHQPQSTLSDPR